MKTIIFVIFVSLSKTKGGSIDDNLGKIALPEYKHSKHVTSKVFEINFEQILDHFDNSSDGRWIQRGWMNNEFVKSSDSPVFLMVGGNSPADQGWLKRGTWYDWAKDHNAVMFLLEHRFYGESRPTKDVSTDNLKFLSTQQALKDLSYFIQELNEKHGFTSINKWILFGGSYAGDLVAWARAQHPGLVHGAVASSAPLLATADFSEFNVLVRNSLNHFVAGCADLISQAVNDIQSVFNSNKDIDKLLDKFRICSKSFDPSKWQDRGIFYQSLSDIISQTVQFNKQRGLSISTMCHRYLMNTTIGTPSDRLAALKEAESKSDRKSCEEAHYKTTYPVYKEFDWHGEAVIRGERQWLYQRCSEFGLFETSSAKTSLYANVLPFQFYTQLCTDVFGRQFNEQTMLQGVANLNKRNKGRDIKVTNVAFIQGSVDPYHALGAIKYPTDNSPYILIEGTSNSYDMLSPQITDSDALKKARQLIGTKIVEWLSN